MDLSPKTKKKCDKLYQQYNELLDEYHKIKLQLHQCNTAYAELQESYEISKHKVRTNMEAVKRQIEDLVMLQNKEILSPKRGKGKKKVSFQEKVDVKHIPLRGTRRKVLSRKTTLPLAPSWTEFLKEHAGRGYNIKQMSAKFREMKM